MKNVFILFLILIGSIGCGKTFSPNQIDTELMIKGMKLIITPQENTTFDYQKELRELKTLTSTVGEPPFPDDLENSKTIQGVDSNKNGIRDDVEIFINRNFYSSDERQALKQLAKTLQLFFLKDADVFKLQKENYLRSLACVENVMAYNYDLELHPQKTNKDIKRLFYWTFYSSSERALAWESIRSKLPEVLNDLEISDSKYCDFRFKPAFFSERRSFYHWTEEQWWVTKKMLDILAFGHAHREFENVDIEKERTKLSKIKASENAPKVFDGFIEPPMPDPLISDRTVEGIDSNNDGIRDDVEIWINRTAKDDFMRKAMKQYARFLRKRLIATFWEKSNSEVGLDMYDGSKAYECIYSYFKLRHNINWSKDSLILTSRIDTFIFGPIPVRKLLWTIISRSFSQEIDGNIFENSNNVCAF